MTERDNYAPPTYEPNIETDSVRQVDFSDYLRMAKRHVWVIAGLLVLALGVAFVRTKYFLPRIYEAKATLLPLKESQGGLLGSIQGMPLAETVIGGLGGSLGTSDKDRLVTILKSQAIQDKVTKDLELVTHFVEKKWRKATEKRRPDDPTRIGLELAHAYPKIIEPKPRGNPDEGILTMSDEKLAELIHAVVGKEVGSDPALLSPARSQWHRVVEKALTNARENVSVQAVREGLITVSVRFDDDRIMAAEIANRLVAYLETFLKDTTLSYARRQREFVENRVKVTENDLHDAEEALKTFKSQRSVISLPEQVQAAVTGLATLQAELEAKKIAHDALLESGAALNNPQLKAVRTEIAGLEKRLDELEQKQGGILLKGTGVRQVPQLEQSLGELMRNKLVQETLYTLLIQEYETAKIREEKEQTSFQLLDTAQPPSKHVLPRTGMNLLFGGAIGLILAFVYVAVREASARHS